ncbi:MAG: hypothetical protein ACREPA_01035 [Candidatus Dormibacteraceae bacterium]
MRLLPGHPSRHGPGYDFARRAAAGDFFTPDRIPDLPSQLELLLSAVWAAERNWRFDDRLELAARLRR